MTKEEYIRSVGNPNMMMKSELMTINNAWDAATKQEREACATVCDKGLHQVRENGWIDAANERARCAAAIRARSNV